MSSWWKEGGESRVGAGLIRRSEFPGCKRGTVRWKAVSLGKQETKGDSWSEGRTNNSTAGPSVNGVSACGNR